jgi:hypothetical protein
MVAHGQSICPARNVLPCNRKPWRLPLIMHAMQEQNYISPHAPGRFLSNDAQVGYYDSQSMTSLLCYACCTAAKLHLVADTCSFTGMCSTLILARIESLLSKGAGSLFGPTFDSLSLNMTDSVDISGYCMMQNLIISTASSKSIHRTCLAYA